jgi:hypothetical protein
VVDAALGLDPKWRGAVANGLANAAAPARSRTTACAASSAAVSLAVNAGGLPVAA